MSPSQRGLSPTSLPGAAAAPGRLTGKAHASASVDTCTSPLPQICQDTWSSLVGVAIVRERSGRQLTNLMNETHKETEEEREVRRAPAPLALHTHASVRAFIVRPRPARSHKYSAAIVRLEGYRSPCTQLNLKSKCHL